MVRTEVQFSEEQWLALTRAAAADGLTEAEAIVRSVERYLKSRDGEDETLRQRALRAAGRFASGVTDLSQNHDHYLTEADKH